MNSQTSRTRRALSRSIVVVLIVAIGALGVTTFAVMGGGSTTNEPRTANIVDVSRTSFDIVTTATGELEARNQVEIRSQLERQSTIMEIIDEGTTVEEGDILVQLNSDEIQTEIEEDLLGVESARAELVAAENGYEIQVSQNESAERAAKLKLELAKLSLNQWMEGEVKQTRMDNDVAIREAQLNLERTLRDRDRLEERVARNAELYEKGFLSKNEYELEEIALTQAKASYEKAEAALAKAKLQKNTYELYQFPKDQKTKDSDVEEAQAELDRVKRQNEIQLASKDADRVNRRRHFQMREERLKDEQRQLENCTIRAPKSGLVVYSTSMQPEWRFDSRGPLQIGRQVHPNELLIVLPDTSEMVASVRVHERLAGRVKPGQAASITIEALGGLVVPGVVDRIGILAEGGGWRDPNRREYTVKISLDVTEAAEKIKPSMRCEAEIRLGNVSDALAVPIEAVYHEGAVWYVYTPAGSKFARRPVKVGRRSDSFAEIVAGLGDGERVVLREPSPGEIVGGGWKEAELQVVGLKLNDEGEPVPEGQEGQQRGPGGTASVAAMPASTESSGERGGRERSKRSGGGEREEQPATESGDDAPQKTTSDAETSTETAETAATGE